MLESVEVAGREQPLDEAETVVVEEVGQGKGAFLQAAPRHDVIAQGVQPLPPETGAAQAGAVRPLL